MNKFPSIITILFDRHFDGVTNVDYLNDEWQVWII